MNIFFVTILLVGGILHSNSILAAGSCDSQSGHWSKIATTHANNLEGSIKELAQKAECSFFGQASERMNLSRLKSIDASRSENGSEVNDILSTPKNLANVRNLVSGSPADAGKIGKMALANMTIKSAGAPIGAIQFVKGSVDEGLDYVGHFLDSMNDPSNEKCLRVSGFPVQGIITSSMKVVNSLADSNYASNGKVNGIISKLMTLLDNSHVRSALQMQATLEFWNELSCLIESTTDNYCSIRDARQMNVQVTKAKSEQFFKTQISADTEYNPLEAYFVLTRDIPNISKWVLEVLFGNEPMTMTEADRKNKVWDTIVALLKDENTVIGTINEKILEIESLYRSESGLNGKKTKIIEILRMVTKAITGEGWGEKDTLNFVKSNYPVEQIPFLLIGMEKIPPPVTGIDDGTTKNEVWTDPSCDTRYKMNNGRYKWDQFLENQGAYHCSLDNPDQVIKNIVINYRKIMSLAKVQALDYLNDFLVVDKIDLVSSLYKGVGVSVFESMFNVYNYLLKFQSKMTSLAEHYKSVLMDRSISPSDPKKIEVKRKLNEYANMKGNVDNLIPKLERIFDALDKEAMISLDYSLANSEEEKIEIAKKQEELKLELSSEVIKVVFKEFNVLLQQSNFLKRRIETFVLYDMRTLVREDILDDYLSSWMVVSGNSIMDFMSLSTNSGFESSYATVEEDIQNALAIANMNLSMLETFSKDYMIGAINSLNAVEEGTYGTWDHFWDMLDKQSELESTLSRKVQRLGDLKTQGASEEAINDATESLAKEIGYKFGMPVSGTVSPMEMWSGVKSLYFMIKHRKRYPLSWKLDSDEVLLENYGNDGSLAHLRDKFCIQTLFYKNNSTLISGLCEGAEITNQYVENVYKRDDAAKRKLKLVFNELSEISGDDYAERVCAFRDYKRNNEALMLLDQIKSE